MGHSLPYKIKRTYNIYKQLNDCTRDKNGISKPDVRARGFSSRPLQAGHHDLYIICGDEFDCCKARHVDVCALDSYGKDDLIIWTAPRKKTQYHWTLWEMIQRI